MSRLGELRLWETVCVVQILHPQRWFIGRAPQIGERGTVIDIADSVMTGVTYTVENSHLEPS